MPTADTLRLLAEVRASLAGSSLTASQAKLYSQRLRCEMGRPGLRSFTDNDTAMALDHARLLIESALIERTSRPNSNWRQGIKRAAALLEFLSQPDIRPTGAPTHLLAAAAYQVARLPAMALALLKHMPPDEPVSQVLRAFLCADFPAALEGTRLFWRDRALFNQPDVPAPDPTVLTVRHTVMAIGTVCSYFRTGDATALDRAVTKLHDLAASVLHSRDPYSYLLARLTALAAAEYARAALWRSISALLATGSAETRAALQQFAHAAFSNRRALVWDAQAAGIARLANNTSFVLSTPTGSGKTAVATLGIVQALFTPPPRPAGLEGFGNDNLILYLVPSRALAAEVESRLQQDLYGVAAEPVLVTGLYGGIDWGPTDAWVQADAPTILICTFEKADALLRYLGILFLYRVRLVIVDEAHMVEQDPDKLSTLWDGTSRAFRLELLGTRLREAQKAYNFRIVALSAVAGHAAPALARWISGNPAAQPTVSTHRSTRQMLGRLEVAADGQFTIRYDQMDGRSLHFSDERPNESPFVPGPFPPMPGGVDFQQPEKALRAPTLWAALHLAAQRADGRTPSVLISVTQQIQVFAADCADHLDIWPPEELPNYWDPGAATTAWANCLASAADYFTEESAEYRLLRRGIAVHHGKMPGLLARRLKLLIEGGIVRIIIATSTLSEGVNIPVTYLLIPSLFRANSLLSLQEFSNLIGRVGRPGVATEGHVLVVLPQRIFTARQWRGYGALRASLEAIAQTPVTAAEQLASSPLAALLAAMARIWARLTPGATAEEFYEWLEQTAITEHPATAEVNHAVECLDSLDSFLLATIQEVEELGDRELAGQELETELRRLWECSYAFAAARNEGRLRNIWLARGRALKTLYPDELMRRRIYRTSLTPRSALVLVTQMGRVRQALVAGADYAVMTTEERLAFVADILALLTEVPSFRIEDRLGKGKNSADWRTVLRWWLAKRTLTKQPKSREVTKWYAFAARNFLYRGTWGLGSVLSLLLDVEDDEGPIRAIEIDDWPRSGLPWAAFWLKEIITWGTLEPVAAFLLARAGARERDGAERESSDYYQRLPAEVEANERLDPRRIRAWVNERAADRAVPTRAPDLTTPVALARERDAYLDATLRVMQFEVDGTLNWISPAGYVVARSPRPHDWPPDLRGYDFTLEVGRATVRGLPYLPYGRGATA